MIRTLLRKQLQRVLRFVLRSMLAILRIPLRWLPWNAGLRVGAGLGATAYVILGRERRRAMDQLQQALGGERSVRDCRQIAFRSFCNLGRTFYEVLNMDRIDRRELNRRVRFEGEEALKAAASLGRGVIFVTGHVGNWEWMGAAVAMRYPLAVVAAPIYDPLVEEVMIRLRAAQGIETLVRDSPGSVKGLIRMLHAGGVVGLLIDQDTKADGVFVPFFHREAFTPAGAARLAFRTGASVVVGFILRERGGRHRVVIQGPLDLHETGDADRDIHEATARFTKMIEDQIRETPDQWIWMHRRWKRRPQSASEPEAPPS
jgi:Kdo2-lipid IVA lauroyltransferase/acyltransferase